MIKKVMAVMTTLGAIQEMEKEPVSIEYILDNISPDIDKKIIDTVSKKELNPISGEIIIYIDDHTKDVIIEWDFYFEDRQGKSDQMTKISSKKMVRQEYITRDDYFSLKNEPLKFQIISPNIKYGD
ncbi:hypothetical protein [Moraxella nonliquefaciens]|uniref:Uncharacterized protein n=1 Tax=Moraxella nonliquefaciens TaxID=478 RepID=A0A1B8PLU4_MORNO|nr:hypothetical protein [Moraxella nonliquefaciens]OBX51975.1 hypothetical protein A9Z60_05260 [Moraxella nonliquefaciens]